MFSLNLREFCRGQIKNLNDLKASEFDAVVFPGGFGAALHLSSRANKGATCEVLQEVRKTITDFHIQGKPIGAMCIAPVLLAKVLGDKKVTLTIGNDKETAAELKKTGAQHVDCPVDDFITDRDHKIVTTPAYMFEAKPAEVFRGISKMIKELAEMA